MLTFITLEFTLFKNSPLAILATVMCLAVLPPWVQFLLSIWDHCDSNIGERRIVKSKRGELLTAWPQAPPPGIPRGLCRIRILGIPQGLCRIRILGIPQGLCRWKIASNTPGGSDFELDYVWDLIPSLPLPCYVTLNRSLNETKFMKTVIVMSVLYDYC